MTDTAPGRSIRDRPGAEPGGNMSKRIVRLTEPQLKFLRDVPGEPWLPQHQPQRIALRQYGLIAVVELDNGERDLIVTERGLAVVESGATEFETTYEEISRIRAAAVEKWAGAYPGGEG